MAAQIAAGLLTETEIWQTVLMFFSAGLVTGGIVFITSIGISNALKIFKSI